MVDFKNGTFDLHLNEIPRRPRCASVQSVSEIFQFLVMREGAIINTCLLMKFM